MSFIRKYEILIGKPYTFNEGEDVNARSNLGLFLEPTYRRALILEQYFASESTNSIAIRDHHVEIDIEKTGGESSDGNQANVVIFNLSDETVKYLENNSGDKTFITIKAGYSDDGLLTIFRGNVTKVIDQFEGVNRKTKLTLSDGGVFIKEQLTSRSYPKGTKLDKIVDDLVLDLDLPRGSIAKLGDDVVTKSRTIFYGKSADQLKRVLESRNFAFNIQDMFTYVIARAQEKAKEEAQSRDQKNRVPVISPETGLIGSPSFIDDSASMTSKEADINPPNGIKFRSLMNGALLPNTYVKIKSRKFNGIYRISKVHHRGSYEGSEWYTDCEAENVALANDATTVEKETVGVVERQYTGEIINEITGLNVNSFEANSNG